MEYRFAKSADKHNVRRVEVIKIIESKPGTKIGESREKMDKLAWSGSGNLDQKIEIIAIDFINYQYVIHAMPIEKRGEEKDDYMDRLW